MTQLKATNSSRKPKIARLDMCADQYAILHDALVMARALACDVPASNRLPLARSMVAATIQAYWYALQKDSGSLWALPGVPSDVKFEELPQSLAIIAERAGQAAATLPVLQANYQIGIIYTGMMPQEIRSELGAFYTPPALCERLIDIATDAGVNWNTAKVLDPACGGGAFLAPVAWRMANALAPCSAKIAVKNIGQRLRGFEIDPFAAWMSQAFLESTLLPLCKKANMRLPQVIEVCDSLNRDLERDPYDLVIGNPPYGRIKLTAEQRNKYKRSLFGHANLYGLFTDLAMRFAKSDGVIAYVTPTSFLAGEYFKSLRQLLGHNAPPAVIDFVSDRKGVFEDVLQETLLAAYRCGGEPAVGQVNFLKADAAGGFAAKAAGAFKLPADLSQPWLMPRSSDQSALVTASATMPHRLRDYGYKVSTGPLVWNRHKSSLRDMPTKGAFPLVWAESVRPDGTFDFRAERRNHKPWFLPSAGEEWVVTDHPCVLLQRTTAKEQNRRLIAAELPANFLRKHRAIVVENHLNMIRAIDEAPTVPTSAISALLNSQVVDALFRCVSGSVAVSAFELESLPLPDPAGMAAIQKLVERGAKKDKIEVLVAKLYGLGGAK